MINQYICIFIVPLVIRSSVCDIAGNSSHGGSVSACANRCDGDDIDLGNNLKYLSELPLHKLLKVKKSIEDIYDINHNLMGHPGEWSGWNDDDEHKIPFGPAAQFAASDDRDHHQRKQTANESAAITALPLINLQNANTINRRTHVEPWDTKPSKIQTIFQLSVTALAFLAFAGYLLCMIVQAIKSKGTTYYHPTFTTTNVIKKRRPLNSYGRRRRRDVFVAADNVQNQTRIIDEEISAGPDPDQMYAALLLVAEGYVKLNFI